MLTLPPLRHLGLISYSLYLWHWSVLCLGRWTVGLQGWWMVALVSLMVVLAELSYHCIEAPLRRSRWAATANGALSRGGAVSGALAGLLTWLALGGGGHRLYAGEHNPTIREQLGRQRIEGTTIAHQPCHLGSDLSPDDTAFTALTRRCIVPAPTLQGSIGAGRLIFVAGLRERPSQQGWLPFPAHRPRCCQQRLLALPAPLGTVDPSGGAPR